MTERSPLLLIANPAARRVTEARIAEVTAILSRRFDVRRLRPTGAADVRRMAREAAEEGRPLIAAMGGDGLICNVVSGIVDSRTALAILPGGTVNALARSLGVPLDAVTAAAELQGRPALRALPVALLTLTGPGGTTSRHAMSQVGIGFDAEVVDRVERSPRLKRRFGSLFVVAMVAGVIASWRAGRERTIHLEADGRGADAATVVIQVHWPYTYLGRLPLALTRRPGSGLDVLVVDRVSARRLLSAGLRALTTRDYRRARGIEVWPGCRRLRLRVEPGLVVQADGEPLGPVETLEIVWSRDALRLANPAPVRS